MHEPDRLPAPATTPLATPADAVAAGYRAAADAPATLRATLAGLAGYQAWCAAVPATPQTVAATLAALAPLNLTVPPVH